MDREKYLKEKYRTKKSSTKGRLDKNGNEIEFRLTYEEWKTLWDKSGLLPSRDYVLSRINDLGHYEIGNVYVNHNLLNITEALTDNSDLERRITQYSIETKIKRRIVKAMIKRGDLSL